MDDQEPLSDDNVSYDAGSSSYRRGRTSLFSIAGLPGSFKSRLLATLGRVLKKYPPKSPPFAKQISILDFNLDGYPSINNQLLETYTNERDNAVAGQCNILTKFHRELVEHSRLLHRTYRKESHVIVCDQSLVSPMVYANLFQSENVISNFTRSFIHRKNRDILKQLCKQEQLAYMGIFALRVPITKCYENIQKNGSASDRENISVEYLQKLGDVYEDFIHWYKFDMGKNAIVIFDCDWKEETFEDEAERICIAMIDFIRKYKDERY